MFGRLTRVVALAAMVTHLWVTMVVAPWHHLVEHRLAALEPASETETSSPLRSCSCRHHSHQTKSLPICDEPIAKHSGPGETPAAPADHDDCPICQVLTQHFTTAELPLLAVTPERMEFSPPVSAVQPLLGASIEPVSRGPPAV